MISLAFVLALVVVVCGQEDPLAALAQNIPGVPGEDYPIFVLPPETQFDCNEQIEGYYADTDADCQAFHICAPDGSSSLLKYSFLCPNGTLFNQQYFICDWWFNVDCAESAALAEEKNSEIAAARDAAAEASASDAVESYAAPAEVEEVAAASDVAGGYLAPEEYEYDDQAAYGGAPTYSGRF